MCTNYGMHPPTRKLAKGVNIYRVAYQVDRARYCASGGAGLTSGIGEKGQWRRLIEDACWGIEDEGGVPLALDVGPNDGGWHGPLSLQHGDWANELKIQYEYLISIVLTR